MITVYALSYITLKQHSLSRMVAQRFIFVMLTIALLTRATTTTRTTSSWFREKYNEQTYDDYYDYTVSRYSLEDNDRDTCPDFHRSASIFAVTGQQIRRISRTCSSLYVKKGTSMTLTTLKYTPREAHYIQLIEVTVADVVEFIWMFMCYLLEFAMLLVSFILLSVSTLFMVLLLFCQY